MSSLFVSLALLSIPFFFVIGAPIFAIAGAVTTLIFYDCGESLAVIAQDIFKLAAAPSLIALPLFIFTGYYLAESTFAARLLKFFESIAGWMKGGVCLAAIVATAIFTAFTGASAVTIVAFGGLISPMLIKKGYSEKFAEGLLTISGGTGALLPPCFAVILYGLISRTDIRWLFIAGFVPTIILILAQYFYSMYVSIKVDIPATPFSFKELFKAIRDLKFEIPLLLIIVGGIFTGFVSVDEAATITVVGFFVIESVIYKDVKWGKMPHIIGESMMMLGALFLIMGCALALADYMVLKEIPQKILAIIETFVKSKLAFLMCLNVLLIIVGMLLDMFSAILIIVPLIIPIANSYGVDPFHLGVIFFLNLELGYVTPPFGVSLFISSLRFKEPVIKIFRSVLPFATVAAIVLLIITYNEDISLFVLQLLDLRPGINIHMI